MSLNTDRRLSILPVGENDIDGLEVGGSLGNADPKFGGGGLWGADFFDKNPSLNRPPFLGPPNDDWDGSGERSGFCVDGDVENMDGEGTAISPIQSGLGESSDSKDPTDDEVDGRDLCGDE